MTHSFPTRRSSDLVNGEEARAAEPVGQAERHAGGGHRCHGVEAGGRERNAFEGDDRQAAGSQTHRRADRELDRSEEHTSELQSLMRISYAVFCLKKKKHSTSKHTQTQQA